MRKENVELIGGFFRTQANHWALFPAAVTILGLTGGERPDLLWWFFVSLAPFLFFLVRRRTNHILIFTAVHAAVAAAAVVFARLTALGTAQSVLGIGFVAGYALYSTDLRLQKTDRRDGMFPPPIAVAVSAVALLLQRLQGVAEWDGYYTVSLVSGLGCWALGYYADRYLWFISVNEGVAGVLPKREIFRAGAKMAAVYTALGGLLLLVTANVEWLGALLAPLKSALTELLRFLVNIGTGPTEDVETADHIVGGFYSPQVGEHEIWPFLKVLEKIFMAAAVILFAAAAAAAVILIVRYIRDRFRRRLSVKGGSLDSVSDLREDCGIDKRGGERSGILFKLSPEGRVRALYKKQVARHAAQLLGMPDGGASSERSLPGARLNTLTARECGRRLEREEMSDIYELVRYSGKECTGQEVRLMRRSCR